MSKSSKLRRLRPSPAAAIAVVALVFAASGVAVALPGKNSVATKDIKKNAVTAAKIKNGSVTTAKLANDAVTGAKVNEATLGKVPSATTAETATKATTAETATKATTAEKATNATNAQELEGRTLSQVRPLAAGAKDESSQGLPSGAFASVMTANITIPTGGADVVINAGIELNNGSGNQTGGACRLKISGTVISSAVNVTMPPGHSEAIGLTAFAPAAGAGNRTVTVECAGSGVANDVDFINGDLAVMAFPIGS